MLLQFDRTTADGSTRRVPQIEFDGATNKAEVSTPDIMLGTTAVVHVVNDVLLPAGLGTA
jgi:hypothetical protein